jgi:hypothetical protein
MSMVEVDLHGFHPDDICGLPLVHLVEQAWQSGVKRLKLIHGHGRNRGLSPGFVNTNTGYFGLRLRGELRHDDRLRCFIKHTTLDCSHPGATTVNLKPNPRPSAASFSFEQALPPSSVAWRYGEIGASPHGDAGQA